MFRKEYFDANSALVLFIWLCEFYNNKYTLDGDTSIVEPLKGKATLRVLYEGFEQDVILEWNENDSERTGSNNMKLISNHQIMKAFLDMHEKFTIIRAKDAVMDITYTLKR